MGRPSEKKVTTSRKKEHVEIVLEGGVEASTNSWEDISLLHEALPEIDFENIRLDTSFLGKELGAPLMIASMTGGYPGAEKINKNLACAAEEHRLAMGVGSQRAALADPTQRRTFSVVREHDLPFVAANVGAPQLVPQAGKKGLTVKEIEEVVSMVEADALIIHLNFLQEAVQPEGDLRSEGVEEAIRRVVESLPIPVIAKETGAGMTFETAQRLRKAGVRAIDVGGVSGTSFAAVELERARKKKDALRSRVGELFREWGVPTPLSVLEAQRSGLPIVATGGLRSGLDVARALSLGATLGGIARASLLPASKGERETLEFFRQTLHELRTALFLTGCKRPADLFSRPVLVTGRTREILELRGHDPTELARRENPLLR